uniref:Glycosyl transferase, WecB/TagA/CpsF family n=1 Tax=uncultured bacterium contig00043 TaxID=1181530 RepID=A0A806JZK7_9BACT|nr:glycosyl transferase, WecB/TagA/CpsF family [uncultured bacterium contig00043]
MAAENTELRQRVNLLKVPLDNIAPENLSAVIYDLLKDNKEHNIVLLSLWDLLRARGNNDYRAYVMGASLVIPISRSVISGAKFLTGKKITRYMPFDFIVSLLTILEAREFTCYLLGGRTRVVLKTERNIKQTFPKLRVVGRFPGHYKKQTEPTIIEAIKKAAPSLLLVGKGVRGEERWIAKNNAGLGHGLRLWCSDIFDVFSERKKHPSRTAFDHGLEWIGYCFQKPYKFFRIFPYIYYKIMLLGYKLFRKNEI